MRAHLVQAHEDEDHGAGHAREQQPAMEQGQKGNSREGEGVLQQPGIAVRRVDSERDPPHAKEHGED